jgi:hypothetical protein
MRPAPGEVLHFSEDPTVTELIPHVAATVQQAKVLTNLWPFWDAVIGSTLRFNGIRLRNALLRNARSA